MPRSNTPSPADPGGRLQSALTQDQIQTLLNVLVEAGHLQTLDNRLRAADQDLADTVRRIQDEPRTKFEAVPSSQKTIEIWNTLWASWADHVAEVGDEEGSYVNHEEHWHPPYFDLMALRDELDEAAGPLSEWIDHAFPLVKEPDLFLESLVEINENIRSFPDWFQPVDDNLVLGPRASSCVLRWTWLGLVDQSESGRQLVEIVGNLEVPGQHTELDQNVCFQFFAELPESVCREIHAYLCEAKFEGKVANVRSVWHRIQHEYQSRFDPSTHLQKCEEHLELNWHYGEPLIADAASRKDLATAERFIELTLSSLLRWSAEEPWRPEEQLFPESRYYRPPEENQAILRLLDQWEDIAARRKKTERVASLRLQRAILKSSEDWGTVLAAFQEYQCHPVKPALVERLFTEWRQCIAAACAPQESANEPTTDSWTQRLIDAQRNPASHQDAFIEHAEVWVECCQTHVAFFQKNWRSLALLTRHLPWHAETQARCPMFHSQVLVPALSISENMQKSIRNALLSLGNKLNHIDVQPVWQQHLHTLIPTPGGSGSYYRDSALWMKALSEVSQASYGLLLNRWKTDFRRRRSLWSDMVSVGCPGL